MLSALAVSGAIKGRGHDRCDIEAIVTTVRSSTAVMAHGGMPSVRTCGGTASFPEEVTQQIDGDPAVGDHRDRPKRGGQPGEEAGQPPACLP